MKITLMCMQCADTVDKSSTDSSILFDVPLGNASSYKTSCPRGHVVSMSLQNPKFEMLFESGINALKDGYYREAVSSFAVSLERFQEFLIQSYFVPEDNSYNLPEAFTATWNGMVKQSERQIGAFHMLYLLDFKAAPPLLDKKFVDQLGLNLGIKGNDPSNFRNIVTHQGYIPTFDQALAYGEAVNRFIFNLLVRYCRKHGSRRIEKTRAASYLHEMGDAGAMVNQTLVSSFRCVVNADLNQEDIYMPLKDYIGMGYYQRHKYFQK